MIRVGITGSIASGKTTVGKILSKKKGPFFSADDEVKKLYSAHHLKVKISKKLNFKLTKKFKNDLKRNIINTIRCGFPYMLSTIQKIYCHNVKTSILLLWQ